MFIRSLFLVLIIFHLFTISVAQCPIQLEDIDNVDQLTAADLLELQKGEILETSYHEDWIVKLELTHCSSGFYRSIMHTNSGRRYVFRAPDLDKAYQWMQSAHPSRFYWDEIKPNPQLYSMNTAYYPYSDYTSSRCREYAKDGLRCKRQTYHDSGVCWQHR